jgi:hypothetical protein
MRDRVRLTGQRLIDESFPVMQGKKIHFIVLRFRFFALSVWIPLFIRFIVISRRTRNFTDEVLTGILAHELCHQERYYQMGIWGYLKLVARYSLSNKARTDEERATDTLTIEKGYGRNLYELTLISHKDNNHRTILDNYLTPEEIKTYSRSIGKW